MNNSNYTYTKNLLINYEQTLKEMKRLALTYWQDLLIPNKFNFDFYNATLLDVHKFLKDRLQYISDPDKLEHLSRIKYSIALANRGNYPLDCDDKTIILLAYLILQNYKFSNNPDKPFKIYICVAGRNDKPHHVYPMADLPGVFTNLNLDSTYPQNEFGKPLFPEKFFKKYYLFTDL